MPRAKQPNGESNGRRRALARPETRGLDSPRLQLGLCCLLSRTRGEGVLERTRRPQRESRGTLKRSAQGAELSVATDKGQAQS